MAELPPQFQFFRPILWQNPGTRFYYSTGGTANIVRFLGQLFVLSAKHCLTKEAYTIHDLRIPFRIRSEAYCQIGRGVEFSMTDADGFEQKLTDVQIHLMEGPSCENPPLEPGEYLDIDSFEPNHYSLPRFLTGFATEEQRPDYDRREMGGIGRLIAGHDGGDTNDLGCRYFRSPSLVGKDVDGMSGGLITSDVLGNVQLEGICVQGGGNREIDFVRFISVIVLQEQFARAWETLIAPQGTAPNP